jgi:serine/threonine protein kinase
LTGKRVCQYRVLEVLGGGGMGMVYKAEDLKLGRRAALKFLPEELAGDPHALQRLEREAQTASALNHPNICTIYDIEDYQGQPFIAMELLEGETLQQHLAASAPNGIAALSLIDIATQACLGLEAAHGKDIVHRDIKPANIFLTKQAITCQQSQRPRRHYRFSRQRAVCLKRPTTTSMRRSREQPRRILQLRTSDGSI